MKFEQSKLGELLSIFDKNQLKKLVKFIRYGDNEVSKTQINYLTELVKKQNSSIEIIEEKLLKKYFGNNTSLQNKTKSNILHEALKYLKLKLLEEEYFIGNYKLLKFLKEKGLKKNYKSSYNQLEKYIDKKTEHSQGLLQGLENYYFSHLDLEASKTKRDKINVENIEKSARLLDDYYALLQLRMQCEILNRSIIAGAKKTVDSTKINFLLKHKSSNPNTKTYQNLMQLHKVETDQWNLYKKTSKLFFNELENLNETYVKDMQIQLINYCTISLNKGNHKYISELWVHQKFLEENKQVNKASNFDPFLFLNFVLIGLISDDIDWVKNYINKTKNRLLNNKKNIKTKVIELAEIMCVFYDEKVKNRLDECQKRLVIFNTKDKQLYLISQKLFLKILYEQQEHSFLKKEIRRIKKYLSNYKTIKGRDKEKTINFLGALMKLCNKKALKLKPSDFSFMDYNWLLNTINKKK